MFVATANSLSPIHPALRDRMEMINISGYTLEEKSAIAKRHLLPKQLKEHGLKNKQLSLNKAVLDKMVEGYTRESGVRGLEKQVAKAVRYAAKSIAMEENYKINVFAENDSLGSITSLKLYSTSRFGKLIVDSIPSHSFL